MTRLAVRRDGTRAVAAVTAEFKAPSEWGGEVGRWVLVLAPPRPRPTAQRRARPDCTTCSVGKNGRGAGGGLAPRAPPAGLVPVPQRRPATIGVHVTYVLSSKGADVGPLRPGGGRRPAAPPCAPRALPTPPPPPDAAHPLLPSPHACGRLSSDHTHHHHRHLPPPSPPPIFLQPSVTLRPHTPHPPLSGCPRASTSPPSRSALRALDAGSRHQHPNSLRHALVAPHTPPRHPALRRRRRPSAAAVTRRRPPLRSASRRRPATSGGRPSAARRARPQRASGRPAGARHGWSCAVAVCATRRGFVERRGRGGPGCAVGGGGEAWWWRWAGRRAEG